ncbi:hypothetical protein Ccrd_009164 [Cynara cardunculus var. scolymus]|uniref:Protein kinase domain-containing protein n=1 Tax=Cynara cardunculus var. scolymus TaxID=59895 RepID=A0A103YNQ2_CYNCS|nr:hypothetical protein Ccrd_009164 [Cynara cardunculus var. scolymus]
MENYDILEQIGKGSYVLKKIRLARQSDRTRRSAILEMELISKVQNPFIVEYKDSWVEKGCYVCIIIAHCEGGDINSANGLFNSWQPLITCTKVISSIEMLSYMCPELLADIPYGSKSDIWSLGCCIYEMMAFKPAFKAFAADLLKHSYLQPYVHKLHLNLNHARRHTIPLRWSDYNYEKKTTFIEPESEPEPEIVRSRRKHKKSFSSDRALNPSISEHDQASLYSENIRDLSRSLSRKLSIDSIDEEKPVVAKTLVAIRTPLPVSQTPANRPSRKTSLPKPNIGLSSIESPDVSVNAPHIDKMTEIPLSSIDQRLILSVHATSSISTQCCSSGTYPNSRDRSITRDHCTIKTVDRTQVVHQNGIGEHTTRRVGSSNPSLESWGQQQPHRFDTSSYQQRAEALEGLLEFSAQLMQQERIDELAVLLKPFGPEKVSPRETAIWLSKSFKRTSDHQLSVTSEKMEYLESVKSTIMKNLGPSGPGLLAITGVPNASILRRTLLPMARKLALLKNEDRKLILKDHGLGSDVPLKNIDRTVSPFAMQLRYDQDPDVSNLCSLNHSGIEDSGSDVKSSSEFKNLGNIFKDLGNCMMEPGLHLARVCDKIIGGHELEQCLLESCSAKGRLIHYHSIVDNQILQSLKDTRPKSKKIAKTNQEHSDLWQQWHYDYGVFTVLTAPMFIVPENNGSCQSCDGKECPSPSGHTYLQILYPNKNSVVRVKASSESFIVQVGESGDILSKGKLRATLHSVCRPKNLENVSRETFVVFLQPAWSKTLSVYDFSVKDSSSNGGYSRICDEENGCAKSSSYIGKLVPPLCDRLKDGMTFAEFSKETTKQYYGSSGLQSKR